ncbi:hypothetical protein [Nonomuraea sp. KM88]|uniref:hypothetical protein n=1 Tax=Nonomuraea sp. KM88 TaxID=3457427 RepID=UPI003FCEB34A
MAPAAAGCALWWVLALGTLPLLRDPGGVALVNGVPAVVGPLPARVLAWAAMVAAAATAGLGLLLPTLVTMAAGSLLGRPVPFPVALRVALRHRRALLVLAAGGAAVVAGVTVAMTFMVSFWAKAALAGVAAVVLLPLLPAVPAVVLEGRTARQALSRAFALAGGRTVVITCVLALCPAVAVLDWWPPGRLAMLPVLMALMATAVTLVFLLALTHGWRGDAPMAFRAVVDGLPAEPPAPAGKRAAPVIALAGLALPGLLLIGVTAANPMDWPAYQRGERSGSGELTSFSHFSVSADGRAVLVRDDALLLECADALCTGPGSSDVHAAARRATAVAGRALKLCWYRDRGCGPGDGLPLPEFPSAVAAASLPGGPGPVVAVLAAEPRSRSSLWLLYCGDPDCGSATRRQIAEVEEPFRPADDQQLAVAVTRDGRPVVVRHNWGIGEVAVFSCDSPECGSVRRTVPATSARPADAEAAGWGTPRPAVAIGQDGYPRVLYHDASSATPVLLECADAACAAARRVPVPAAASRGVRSTLAVDGAGRTLVAVFAPGGVVHLATCATGTCAARPVGTVDGTARAVHLAIDGAGRPLLAWMSEPEGGGWHQTIIRPVTG